MCLCVSIGEMAKTRPGGFSLAVYSLLGMYTSFFGYGLLYVPYVPYGVWISEKIKSREADFFLAAGCWKIGWPGDLSIPQGASLSGPPPLTPIPPIVHHKKSELRGQMRLKLVRSHNKPLSKKLANKDRSSQFSSIGVGVATKWKIGVQVLDSKVSYMARRLFVKGVECRHF